MADTPNLVLTYLAANQSQKHVTVNEALRRIDGMVQLAVLSRTLTAPPASPAEGDRHIVAIGATGVWAGWDLALAFWVDGAWLRLTPRRGWWVYSVADLAYVFWDGTAWSPASTTLTGDITGSGFGPIATSIAPHAVVNAKLAQMPAARLKGNASGSLADAADLSGTEATALLDAFTASLKGLVPASGGGSTTYLRADGTWATPPGGGGGGGGSSTVSDATFVVQSAADTTKQVRFDAGALTTGTTRTFTLPDASGTLALVGSTITRGRLHARAQGLGAY